MEIILGSSRPSTSKPLRVEARKSPFEDNLSDEDHNTGISEHEPQQGHMSGVILALRV
jgi:hypothetical protein